MKRIKNTNLTIMIMIKQTYKQITENIKFTNCHMRVVEL